MRQFRNLAGACTNPISIKIGTLSKNAIKLTDRRTKKIFSVFSLMNLILFVK